MDVYNNELLQDQAILDRWHKAVNRIVVAPYGCPEIAISELAHALGRCTETNIRDRERKGTIPVHVKRDGKRFYKVTELLLALDGGERESVLKYVESKSLNLSV